MISRRSILFGLGGVAAAGVGAGVDRVIAFQQLKQQALAAHTQTAAQIRNLATTYDQRQNQVLQESAVNALRDKVTALQQVELQLPSGEDPMVSRAFAGQAFYYPWLKKIRKSMGFLEYYGPNGTILRGSAEIIDRNGTLVFCAHQYTADKPEGSKLLVTFFPGEEKSHPVNVDIKYIDRSRDLAFGTMQNGARLMRRYGLQPVEWAPLDVSNKPIFIIGFAEGEPRLHLALARHDRYQWIKTLDHHQHELFRDCMRVTKGPAFEGMSGGIVFQNGKFRGILNFSTYPGTDVVAYSTPAEVIHGVYLEQFSGKLNLRRLFETSHEWPAVPQQCETTQNNIMTLAMR